MARTAVAHIRRSLLFAIIGLSVFGVSAATASVRNVPQYRLQLYHTHTHEHIDIVYREGEKYIPGAVTRLEYFLRDHRTGEVHHFDPQVFDLLSALTGAVGRPGAEIDIICGYRAPWSNGYLRRHSSGVAEHSLHMQGMAIDIRIPGIRISRLRNTALLLHRGGVGYYPHSEFVHVDVGRFRRW